MKIDMDLYLKVKELTRTNYDGMKTNNDEKVFITGETLIYMVEDLLVEYGVLEEKHQDLLDKIKKRLDAVEQHEFQIQMIDKWDAGDRLADTLLTREINALKSFLNEENI